jgi:hypothetical protein
MLWWLNMRYYNGSMYGCSGDSYPAGTVPGRPAQIGAGGGFLSTSLVTQGWHTVPGSWA